MQTTQKGYDEKKQTRENDAHVKTLLMEGDRARVEKQYDLLQRISGQ